MSTQLPDSITVAAVQFRSSGDIDDNLARIRAHLVELSARGVDIAAFPECAVTSYNGPVIMQFSPEQLAAAEEEMAAMCREIGIHAIVGHPYYENGELYNGALAWNAEGDLIARYAKIQLAEGWPRAGFRLVTFPVNGVVCSVIVCHDERYPELVRLPVLAGAQVVFYLSCESGITEESKIDPYRAQIVARAEENTVYIVHANTPQSFTRNDNGEVVLHAACSHGQSRIIAPSGHMMSEASIFSEEVLVENLDLSKASRHLANRSLESTLLGDWWREGMKLVNRPD